MWTAQKHVPRWDLPAGLAGAQLGVKTPLPIHEGASRHTYWRYLLRCQPVAKMYRLLLQRWKVSSHSFHAQDSTNTGTCCTYSITTSFCDRCLSALSRLIKAPHHERRQAFRIVSVRVDYRKPTKDAKRDLQHEKHHLPLQIKGMPLKSALIL